MTMRLIWFVLAGFLLGFTVSTLWEWLYYRRRRMVLDAHRYDELQEQLSLEKAANTQLRLMLNGTESSVEAATAQEPSTAPSPQPVAYSSPGVFLDSETDETELQESETSLVEAAEASSSADEVVATEGVAVRTTGDAVSEKVMFGRLAAELEREPAAGAVQASNDADVPYVPRSDDYPDDLSRIEGIGIVYTYRLYKAGIFTWQQVGESDVESLRKTTSAYSGAVVEDWPKQARKLAEEHGREDAIYSGPVPDDLTQLEGLIPADEESLYRAGICTYGQLACQTVADLHDLFPDAEEHGQNLNQWIQSAIELVQNSRDE